MSNGVDFCSSIQSLCSQEYNTILLLFTSRHNSLLSWSRQMLLLECHNKLLLESQDKFYSLGNTTSVTLGSRILAYQLVSNRLFSSILVRRSVEVAPVCSALLKLVMIVSSQALLLGSSSSSSCYLRQFHFQNGYFFARGWGRGGWSEVHSKKIFIRSTPSQIDFL